MMFYYPSNHTSPIICEPRFKNWSRLLRQNPAVKYPTKTSSIYMVNNVTGDYIWLPAWMWVP